MRKELFIKLALLFVVVLFLYSLIDRIPHIDDAWLGEHAYWMSKLGYVKSELMRGITRQETRLLCHHKLFTIQGAFFIKLFGFKLITLKSLTLLYFILFLIIYYLRFFKKFFSPNEFYLSLLLLISNALIFENSFVYRPEIAVMTLGFISYLCIDRILGNKANQIFYAAIGGTFAGLSFATHLNGIIFPVAGFILLCWNRKILLAFTFGLFTIPTILIYFYDFTSIYNLNFWLYQINEAPSLDGISKLPILISFIQNLLDEHLRFFHSPFEITFSILFLSTFIVTYKKLKEYKNLIRYAGLLVFFLALFSVHKASYYMIVYLPYLIIIITLSYRELTKQTLLNGLLFKRVTFQKALNYCTVVFVMYVAINSFYNIQTSTNKFVKYESKDIVNKYISGLTDSCKIVAPLTFVFDEILDFKSIQGDLCYTELQKGNKSIYKEGFLQLTKRFDIDYIILSRESMNQLGFDDFSNNKFLKNDCELIVKNDSFCIIKNKKTYLSNAFVYDDNDLNR